MKAHARILVLLLALAMLLSACGSQEASGGEPEVKDTLIVGNNAEPTVLDPPNQQNTPAALINVQVYDGLLRQNNETGEIEPCLAESWEYVDDCTVRFHLRDDVYGRNPVGSGVVADGPITPAISCYVPAGEDQQYEQDIEKAKQLLKEAGYENGFDLELVCNESQGRTTMAEMLANAWNAIGVKTELRTLEFSALIDLIYSGETQAFLMGFMAGGNDGEFYRTLFQTGGDATAWINYSNPEVDELFDLASKEMDSEKRNEYYAELQTILRDEMPWLWIRFTDNLFGMQKTLTGLDPDPETYCEFRFVKTK